MTNTLVLNETSWECSLPEALGSLPAKVLHFWVFLWTFLGFPCHDLLLYLDRVRFVLRNPDGEPGPFLWSITVVVAAPKHTWVPWSFPPCLASLTFLPPEPLPVSSRPCRKTPFPSWGLLTSVCGAPWRGGGDADEREGHEEPTWEWREN